LFVCLFICWFFPPFFAIIAKEKGGEPLSKYLLCLGQAQAA